MSTYAFQSPIEAQQYNNLVWGSNAGGTLQTGTNNLNMIWGPGYGNKGINQSMSTVAGLPSNAGKGSVTVGQNIISYDNTSGTLSQVAATGIVTSQQWIGLISATNRLLEYQGKSQYSLTTPPGIQQKISAYDQIQTYLNSAAGGMGSGGAPTAQALSGQVQAVTWTSPADSSTRTITCVTSIQWPTGNDARWFFNAGGYIQVSVAGKGSGNDRSSSIANMLNNVGYLTIYYNTSSGTMLGSPGTGYWNTPNGTAQAIFTTNKGAGSYTGSYASVSFKLKTVGVNGANGGANGNAIEITVYVESHTASSFTSTDAINAEVDITWQCFDPAASGSFSAISKAWATPTVNTVTSTTT
jgi:hypothetical protein